jgi:hypothetical protein
VEAVLKVAALTDLARRPAEQIRGAEVGVGPLAYFLLGGTKDR